MKVTALIPDALLTDVRVFSKGENLTESLIIALSEWAKLEKIKELNQILAKKPLKFKKGFNAEAVRTLNRRVT
jgi:hypothetical protein